MRTFRIGTHDDPPCERCGQVYYCWSLDVLCSAIPKNRYSPAVPEGWVPLVLLCDACWRDVVAMLPRGDLST